MPGTFIHMSQAKEIIYTLKKGENYPFMNHPRWEDYFIVGCIIPDAPGRALKAPSHYWDLEANKDHVVIWPEPDRFIRDYPDFLEHPLLAGYYAHLLFDRLYFTRLLPEYVYFTEADGKESVILKDIRDAILRKSGESMPVRTFFSYDYFYGDYIRINPKLVEAYQLRFPVISDQEEDWPLRDISPATYTAYAGAISKELESDLRFLPFKVFTPEDYTAIIHKGRDHFLKTIKGL